MKIALVPLMSRLLRVVARVRVLSTVQNCGPAQRGLAPRAKGHMDLQEPFSGNRHNE